MHIYVCLWAHFWTKVCNAHRKKIKNKIKNIVFERKGINCDKEKVKTFMKTLKHLNNFR